MSDIPIVSLRIIMAKAKYNFQGILIIPILIVFFEFTIGHVQGFELGLDDDGKYIVIWDVDFESRVVHFELIVEAQGFIGFGISEDGNLEGADLIIASIKQDGFIEVEVT